MPSILRVEKKSFKFCRTSTIVAVKKHLCSGSIACGSENKHFVELVIPYVFVLGHQK